MQQHTTASDSMNRVLLFVRPTPQKITCCALALSALTFRTHAMVSVQKRTMSSASYSQTCAAGALEIVQVPCLSDNYGYIIHDKATGSTAVVDTPEAKPYQDELAKRGWKLTHILNTHQ
jgi:hypothetical protein